MCATGGEVLAESIASHVRHVMFVRERRNGALRIFFLKGFVEEDEVGEAAADGRMRGLEGLEIGLSVK